MHDVVEIGIGGLQQRLEIPKELNSLGVDVVTGHCGSRPPRPPIVMLSPTLAMCL